MLSEFWKWWQGSGTPAAAVQQLATILFTLLAAIVGLIGLSTWKRQQRGNERAAAAKEVSDSAALACDHILIERLSPIPMVFFSSFQDFDSRWQAGAIARIQQETAVWEAHKKELNRRIAEFESAVARNAAFLGESEERISITDSLQKHFVSYLRAIDERVSLIEISRKKNTEASYRKMPLFSTLSKAHPLLWRKEKSLPSLEFESDLRRSMDALRAFVSRRS